MTFSIVTPCFRANTWLPLCIQSVADQRNAEKLKGRKTEINIEHIVQDAGSDDGTLDWLPNDSRVTTYVEKDNGMYDAINRGMKRISGELCAYLNADEQYLPGALEKVAAFFAAHPGVDVVFADAVIVDAKGEYICHRKAQVPFRDQLWFRMPVLTCAMFLRSEVFSRHQIFFDTTKKVAGDVFFVMEMQKRGLKMAVLREFTSIFTETEGNLGVGGKADEEFLDIQRQMPRHVKKLLPLYLLYHRVRSVLSGIYRQEPFDYFCYTQTSPDQLVKHHVTQPTQIWKGRTEIDKQALEKAGQNQPNQLDD